MLTDSVSEFLPKLADFYAFLAEARNCPAVTPTIRLKLKKSDIEISADEMEVLYSLVGRDCPVTIR